MSRLALLLLLAVFGLAAKPLSPEQLENELEGMERAHQPIALLRERVTRLLQDDSAYPPSQLMRIHRLACWTQSADDILASRRAIAYADSQLVQAQKQEDDAAIAELLICRGWFNQLLGEVAQARRDYDEGLRVAGEAALPKLEALALSHRGAMLSFQGASGQGLVDLTRAHDIYERLGLTTWYNRAQLEIAAAFRRMGLYAEAFTTLNRLHDHFAHSHDEFGLVRMREQLALVYLETGRYQEAQNELEHSLAFLHQPEYRIEHADRQVMLAEALLGLAHTKEAKRLLVQAAGVLTPDVDPILYAHLELVMAKLQVKIREPAPALSALEKIEPILEAEGHTRYLMDLYAVRSGAFELQGDYPAALAALREHLAQEQRLDQMQREQSTAWVRGQFELTRQAEENKRLRVEQQLQQHELARIKERRFWLLVVMVLCGGVVLLTMRWLLERNRRMHRLAFTDELTGIDNRRRVLVDGREHFELARRQQMPFSLLLFDIDHFKRINDLLGHHQGDRVLQWVSRMVARELRQQDLLGRTGGEEFLALLPETGLEEASRVAERICSRIGQRALPGLSHPVTISIGCACLRDDDQDLAALIRRADAALYRAKGAGRNRVETDN
ncbi:diguanylate cyclase [Aeromonas sp. 600584]|uniref:diguanylate cyclase n=1 Tax=unclassified Aeromonas TaxID=257493 RepID=UPI003B9E1D22